MGDEGKGCDGGRTIRGVLEERKTRACRVR